MTATIRPAEAPVQSAAAFTVRARPPAGRCHECGAVDIRTSCCTCHRLMCAEHGSRRRAGDAGRMRDLAPPPLSRLAERVDGGRTLNFCALCTWRWRAHGREIGTGAAALVLGVATIFWNVVVGAVLLLAAAALGTIVVTSYLRQLRGRRAVLAGRLFIDPGISSISLIDRITGYAVLGQDQDYVVRDLEVRGALSVETEWNDAAWTKVQAHRRRNTVVDPGLVPFSAGALVLRGPVGLDLERTEGCRLVRRSVLLLGDRVGKHRLLNSTDGRGHRGWQITASYGIRSEPDEDPTMPIWLTPTLVPGSDRRSLDLEFQWKKFGPGPNGLPLHSIEVLRLTVPMDWGAVLRTSDDATVRISSGESGGMRTIEWRAITNVSHEQRGRHPVSLAFENEIRSTDVVRGEAVARFDGNLCRVTKIDVHGSNGTRRRERPTRKLYTQVRLGFELSLAAVRYEAIRVLPAPPQAVEEQAGHDASDGFLANPPRQRTFDLVVPDGATIAHVTAQLSEGDYYVKRVVENPPQPGRKASVVNRYWDISGRKYDGVYPIDFHLVLSGHEVHDGGTVTSGSTDMSLSVRGSYTSEAVDRVVHDEWHSLRRRVESALAQCRRDPESLAPSNTRDFIVGLVESGRISRRLGDQLIAKLQAEFGP